MRERTVCADNTALVEELRRKWCHAESGGYHFAGFPKHIINIEPQGEALFRARRWNGA